MVDTHALNITAMFLPSSIQPPRGFMQDYCPVWQFQNHKLCTVDNKPFGDKQATGASDAATDEDFISLKPFDAYDADGSGFLEYRNVDEAGAASGLGNPCGISDTSIVRVHRACKLSITSQASPHESRRNCLYHTVCFRSRTTCFSFFGIAVFGYGAVFLPPTSLLSSSASFPSSLFFLLIYLLVITNLQCMHRVQARYIENNTYIADAIAALMEVDALYNDLGFPHTSKISPQARPNIFATMDKDNDNRISMDEWKKVIAVFRSLRKSNPTLKKLKRNEMLVPTFEPDKTCAQKSFQTTLAIGRQGSGLAFHFHEDGWNELFHGRKRWFFYSPHDRPRFNPRKTQADWLLNVYPTLKPSQMPVECTVEAGQAIYFPAGWHHAVLNLEQNVFTSAFHQTTNVYPDKNTLVQRLEFGRYTYTPPPNTPQSEYVRSSSSSRGVGNGAGSKSEWNGASRDNGGVVLKTLLKLFPNAYEAYDYNGDIHMHYSEWASAIPFYVHAIALNPLYGKGYTKLGDAYTFLNYRNTAAEYYAGAEKLAAKGDRGQFRDVAAS